MKKFLAACTLLLICSLAARAADLDEFKIKREAVFEFAAEPVAKRKGDRVTISFETKGLCDVTVAIENAQGEIVRHLACGVLGPKAPAPFAKNSRKQTLVWDGKDDLGRHIDDKERHSVRVSLGLRARYERTLFWSPKRRWASAAPLIAPAPEGVYVFDQASGVSQLRLFSHAGEYVRTVYPFPAAKLASFKDLEWYKFPQDGRRLPRKLGHKQNSLLSSGTFSKFYKTMGGGLKHSVVDPAKALAVLGNKTVLAYAHINRFTTDGASLGLALKGGKVGPPVKRGGRAWYGGEDIIPAGPSSMVFSPDGRCLYTTGFSWSQYHGTGGTHQGWLNGVGRVKFDSQASAKIETFAGDLKGETKGGKGPGEFRCPASVACDAKGRVYVADNLNDRVQVFTPAGKFLKAIKVPRPAAVAVQQKTGRIYVLSWLVHSKLVTFRMRREKLAGIDTPHRMTVFESLEKPRKIASYPLPQRSGNPLGGYAINTFVNPPQVWMMGGSPSRYLSWEKAGIRILRVEGGKLVEKGNFGAEAARALARITPPKSLRQRMYVNPKTGKLYLAEGDAGVGKSTGQLLQIDPETGKVRKVELPFDAEDMTFDLQGMAYLRARTDIGRFDPKNWREIPWDYGEERKSVGFGSSRAEGAGMRRKNLISSLRIPSQRYNHHGGMMVSVRGHLVVGIHGGQEPSADRKKTKTLSAEKKYAFKLYPGRNTTGLVLVFDKHGRIVHDDALPGISFQHGVAIDKDDNIYLMAMAHRVLDGKPYYDEATDTLIKVGPRKAKVLSTGRSPLKLKTRPKRSPDIIGQGGARLGNAWVQGAEWLYGGVGYHGRHSKTDGFGCDCSNSRFALDYFARSFAPEVEHCSVAVLDSAGNLIMRVGTYGNVDDGKPLTTKGGPPKPRSIGGDEVALFYAPYVTTHTDKRLFIADPGNHRILSVKLDYHRTGRVSFKDVPDELKK